MKKLLLVAGGCALLLQSSALGFDGRSPADFCWCDHGIIVATGVDVSTVTVGEVARRGRFAASETCAPPHGCLTPGLAFNSDLDTARNGRSVAGPFEFLESGHRLALAAVSVPEPLTVGLLAALALCLARKSLRGQR